MLDISEEWEASYAVLKIIDVKISTEVLGLGMIFISNLKELK